MVKAALRLVNNTWLYTHHHLVQFYHRKRWDHSSDNDGLYFQHSHLVQYCCNIQNQSPATHTQPGTQSFKALSRQWLSKDVRKHNICWAVGCSHSFLVYHLSYIMVFYLHMLYIFTTLCIVCDSRCRHIVHIDCSCLGLNVTKVTNRTLNIFKSL